MRDRILGPCLAKICVFLRQRWGRVLEAALTFYFIFLAGSSIAHTYDSPDDNTHMICETDAGDPNSSFYS